MRVAVTDRELVNAALDYAARGIPVFPCRADNKRPHTQHGFKEASVEARQIEAWWQRWPDAMIACPTGAAVGAWVLDIDDPATFEAACAIPLPETRKSTTDKGYHLWFRWNETAAVRNAQRTGKGWPFPSLPGAEARGEGGYVILPPSRHPSGLLYLWERDVPAAHAPAELLELVCAPAPTGGDSAPGRAAHPFGNFASAVRGDENTPYGLSALQSECDLIVSAPAGAQEKALNDGALKIGGLVGGGYIAFRTAQAQLIAAGLGLANHNPSDPWTPQQVNAKVERGLRDGMRSPRLPSITGEPSSRHSADRTLIRVRAGELHVMASEGEAALIEARAPLYVRAGLVRPIVDETTAAHGQRTKVARLAPVDADTLMDRLSRAADWVKFNARKNAEVPTDPPRTVALTILARDGEWRFPVLAGVITTPTLRPDGTILSQPGYDVQTRLLLLDPPQLPPIPDNPSEADAAAALDLLDGLLSGFPFVDDASRSVALSGIITPVVRGAMPVAPLHANTAPVAGSGKSYLIDIASAVHTGERAPVIAAGRTEEETEKRLGAALLNGQPIISIDNVNGQLGGDALCQMIERPAVSLRPLGVSKLVKVESRATMFATGNNIQLVGDMTRRVILCSLDPNMERPELRTFCSNPFDTVLADRGRFVAAALTVGRAYIAAGCPGELPPLASFESWSRVVRSALVWLGRADPVDTMDRARADDPVMASLAAVLSTWHQAVGSSARTTGAIKEEAELVNPLGNPANGELRQALVEVADDRRGSIDARRLGHFVGRHQGRIVNGLKLVAAEDDSHAKQRRWRVVPA
jgi:putative DNA primase/helicase